MQINNIINLPQFYLITGDAPKDANAFLDKLEQCLQNGISLVQFRAKKLTINEYKTLAKHVITMCHSYKAKILLNNHVPLTEELDADGVHLTSMGMLEFTHRPLSTKYIVSASCHNKTELLHAKQIGVDCVTLSPVLPTTSHPDAVHLGWNKFKSLTSLVDFPVFALGGINTVDLTLAMEFGSYGIAAINSLWNINQNAKSYY